MPSMTCAFTEGDEDFLAVYGCVDSWESPSRSDSSIPYGYTITQLGLDSLPDPDEENCDDDDDYSLNGEWDDENFGGGDIHRKLCSCTGSKCNSASLTKSIVVLAAFTAVTALAA